MAEFPPPADTSGARRLRLYNLTPEQFLAAHPLLPAQNIPEEALRTYYANARGHSPADFRRASLDIEVGLSRGDPDMVRGAASSLRAAAQGPNLEWRSRSEIALACLDDFAREAAGEPATPVSATRLYQKLAPLAARADILDGDRAEVITLALAARLAITSPDYLLLPTFERQGMSPDQEVNSDARGMGILASVKSGRQTKEKSYDAQIMRVRMSELMHESGAGLPGETNTARMAYLGAQILQETQGGESRVVDSVANMLAERMDTHRSEHLAWPPIIPAQPIVGV